MIRQPSTDHDLVFRVTQFLVREAWLLDEGRYSEWLELLHEDVHYVVVTRPTLANATNGESLAHLDESYTTLRQRVERMRLGAWAETPPSLTQRLVTNVLVESAGADSVFALSAIHLHRTRLEREVEQFVGRREDLLQTSGGGFRLLRRKVTLAANALPGKNLSVFL